MNWQDKVKEIYNSLNGYAYAVIYGGSYTLPWIKEAHDIDIGIVFEDAEKQQKGIQIFNSLYNRQDLKKDYQLCIHFPLKDNIYGTLFQYEYNFNETLCGEKIEKINIFLDNKIKDKVKKALKYRITIDPYPIYSKNWYHIYTNLCFIEHDAIELTEEEINKINILHDNRKYTESERLPIIEECREKYQILIGE